MLCPGTARGWQQPAAPRGRAQLKSTAAASITGSCCPQPWTLPPPSAVGSGTPAQAGFAHWCARCHGVNALVPSPESPREHRCCSWAAPRPSAFWGLGGSSGEGGASLKKKSRTPQPRHSRVIKTKRQPVRSPGRRWLVCLFSASPREGRALKCYRVLPARGRPSLGPGDPRSPIHRVQVPPGPGALRGRRSEFLQPLATTPLLLERAARAPSLCQVSRGCILLQTLVWLRHRFPPGL